MLENALVELFVYIVGYHTGRLVLGVLTPGIRVEPFEKQRHAKKFRNAWTYKKRGAQFVNKDQRYYYQESVVFAGITFWVLFAVVVVGVVLAS